MAGFDARAHVLHMAEMLELPLDKADVEIVVQHMQATAHAAALVMAAELDDHVEPAAVFAARVEGRA